MAQERVHFSVAPQPLEDALLALAAQANLSISLPNHGMNGEMSAGLSGAYDVDAALAVLLRGKPYRFERVDAHAYRIVAASLPHPTAASAPNDDEIVVTAAREPTALRHLPRSVSHLDATTLDDAGIDNDRQLTRLIGGVSFTNFGMGRDKILLRGVSDGALAGSTQSLVGLYFGDARITYAAPDPDLMLVDISSIDILRGPQGALYGAGAMGGILRIDPHPVDLENFAASFGASAESVEHGGMGQTLHAVINQPLLADRLGVRGVFYDDAAPGWIDNPGLNETNANHSRRRGARAEVLAALSPRWSLTGNIVLQRIDTKDAQYLERTPQGLLRTAHLLEPHDNDFSLYGATLRGSTRFADITSNTSYLTHDWDNRFDVTGRFASLGVDPTLPRPLDESNSLQIIVHETRFSSPAGSALPWFFGVFYADGDSTRDIVVSDGANGVWPDTAYREHRVDGIDEAALFGQVSWRLGPKLTLATGLRVFRNDLSTQSASVEPLLAQSAQTTQHLTSYGAAPDLRLSYQYRDNILFYLSAAEGYRSDGFNTGGLIGAPFGPLQPVARYAGDRIWTFEAGTRFSVADGRLSGQAVFFLSDWRDVQTDALRANNFLYAGNVGDARPLGAELSVRLAPTPHLTINADMLWSEPDITALSPTFPDAAHGTLPGAPEFSAAASVRYEDRLFLNLPASYFVQADARYLGAAKLGFGEGPNVGGYLELDARMGLLNADWSLSVYVDNLSNSRGATFTPGNPYQPGLALETPLRPRTIGIALERRF